MTAFQQFPLYRASVRDPGGIRDIITFLSPDEIERAGGVPPEAVVGLLEPGAEFVPGNFTRNRAFVDFMHDVIRRAAPRLDELSRGARQQGAGWILIHDARAFGKDPEVATKDVIGAFQIENGVIVPESYSPNPSHPLLSEHGIVTPHPEIQDALMAALRGLRFEAGTEG